MNYAKLLNYSKNHLQPNVIACMKKLTVRFVESQQERVYTDLIINTPFMTPVKFKFSNTNELAKSDSFKSLKNMNVLVKGSRRVSLEKLFK